MTESSEVLPEDAFGAVSSAHRIDVLRALATAERDGRDALSFSDLYEAVDVNGTSQLAYHLDRLEGVFVRKTADGYTLTQAGDRVVRAVRSGTYTAVPAFESVDVDGYCQVCGGTDLRADRGDRLLDVHCLDCETRLFTYDFPPGGAEASPADVLSVSDRRVRHEYGMALDGVCPACGASADREVVRQDDPVPGTHYAVAACSACHLQVFAPIPFRLLYHPAVVSFYWNHGVDVTDVPFFEVGRYLDEWETDVRSADPFEASFTVRYDGDSCALTVRDDLSVTVGGAE